MNTSIVPEEVLDRAYYAFWNYRGHTRDGIRAAIETAAEAMTADQERKFTEERFDHFKGAGTSAEPLKNPSGAMPYPQGTTQQHGDSQVKQAPIYPNACQDRYTKGVTRGCVLPKGHIGCHIGSSGATWDFGGPIKQPATGWDFASGKDRIVVGVLHKGEIIRLSEQELHWYNHGGFQVDADGKVTPTGPDGPPGKVGTDGQPDPVMEAGRVAFEQSYGWLTGNADWARVQEAIKAAVRAGVEAATKRKDEFIDELNSDLRKWAKKDQELQKTVESLRAELSESHGQFKEMELFCQRAETERDAIRKCFAEASHDNGQASAEIANLRTQLAARDWIPVSTPPKEEDGKLVIWLNNDPLFAPAWVCGHESIPPAATHWKRLLNRPALPKAEEEPAICQAKAPGCHEGKCTQLKGHAGVHSDGFWSWDPKEAARIPWTMADATKHRDAWFRLKNFGGSSSRMTAVGIAVIWLNGARRTSWDELFQAFEFSHTPEDPTSWLGCWKEECPTYQRPLDHRPL